MRKELYVDDRISDQFYKRFKDKPTLNVAEVAGFMRVSCRTVIRRFQQCEIAGFYASDRRDLRLITDSVHDYIQKQNAFNI